jgi:hypothetical protein
MTSADSTPTNMLLEAQSESPDNKRHDSQVIEGGDKSGEKDDGGQGLKGKEIAQRRLSIFSHRSLGQGQSSEEKLGPCGGAFQHLDHGIVDEQKDLGADRHDKDEQGKKELKGQAPENHPGIDHLFIFGTEPGGSHQKKYPGQADKIIQIHDLS